MRQESDIEAGVPDGLTVADMKRWIYSSFVLTLAIAAFMWQWWRGEMSLLDARVLGVETRLHQQIADSEERQRSDLQAMANRIDKVNDKLDGWFLAQAGGPQGERPRR